MKTIRYEFITEEIVEIEISDEWGTGQAGRASQRKFC